MVQPPAMSITATDAMVNRWAGAREMREGHWMTKRQVFRQEDGKPGVTRMSTAT